MRQKTMTKKKVVQILKNKLLKAKGKITNAKYVQTKDRNKGRVAAYQNAITLISNLKEG